MSLEVNLEHLSRLKIIRTESNEDFTKLINHYRFLLSQNQIYSFENEKLIEEKDQLDLENYDLRKELEHTRKLLIESEKDNKRLEDELKARNQFNLNSYNNDLVYSEPMMGLDSDV